MIFVAIICGLFTLIPSATSLTGLVLPFSSSPPLMTSSSRELGFGPDRAYVSFQRDLQWHR